VVEPALMEAGATLDARALRRAMGEFREALRVHRDELDSLNVFPVPDGDTGTNLLLTQEAVAEALDRIPEEEEAGEVAAAIIRAALMGARGNSGVILSQVLRGLCEGVARGEDLARALEEASVQARRAVSEPAEGTMLTVLRDAAAAAGAATANGEGDVRIAGVALREGLSALGRTPDQLPALREAGIVDAGGRGVVLLLDSLAATLRGAPRTVEVGAGGPVGRGAEEVDPASARYGFEVMYLLECEDGALAEVRDRLARIGDSVAVVGAAGLFNVHVHTDDPGAAVEAGLEAGRPRGIRIASLDEQVARSCVGREARAVRVPVGGGEAPASAEVGVVAVASGPGLARLLESLGATVATGDSIEELVRAVEGAPAEAVLLVAPAAANAEGAAERASKPVRVIQARSAAAAIAATAAFTPESSLDDNARAAARASERVLAAEVRASGGEMVGVVDGEVRVTGTDPVDVAVRLSAGLCGDGHEIMTVLAGETATDDDLRRAREELSARLPLLEVEAQRGDQPGSVFAIGIE
jgi:uncharacterized protein